MAKECWAEEEGVIWAGVAVENIVTLDTIEVSAGWATGISKLNPFLKFIITDFEGGAAVQVLEQDGMLGWRGRDHHLRDVNAWMTGNFTCT